jgi:hypothetical protein
VHGGGWERVLHGDGPASDFIFVPKINGLSLLIVLVPRKVLNSLVEDLLSFGDGLCTQVIIALLLKRGAAPFQ